MTRQQRWQQVKQAQGRCPRCGKPVEKCGHCCALCLAKRVAINARYNAKRREAMRQSRLGRAPQLVKDEA